jgi:hypothetical protein
MNLFKIGDTTLNMDRVNAIQDHFPAAEPGVVEHATVLRVLFNGAHIDLRGKDAQALRRLIRHSAQNLTPRRTEEGEELSAPEEQLQRIAGHLIGLIDRLRPKDTAMRSAAHRLANMIDEYITGQLPPMPADSLDRLLEPARPEGSSLPDAGS